MSKRQSKATREAARLVREAKRERRSHIALNVATASVESVEYHYKNAARFGLMCGDATTSFVGKLPGGMTSGGKPRAKSYNRWSEK